MAEDNREKNTTLIRTQWGFYQYRPLPTDEELQKHYAQRYYQQGLGSYRVSYSDEELRWFKLVSWILYRGAMRLLPEGPKSFLDVGCGEGWHMNQFHQAGHSVLGIDYSQFGIEKFHPHLTAFFRQGDVGTQLQDIIHRKQVFDVIGLFNVIEHVKYPHTLLENLRAVMHAGSVLIIKAPNDFSPLHEHLKKTGLCTEPWWLAYPEHLSYFNKESMYNFLADMGYTVRQTVADNPIDLNLLNDNSNYMADKSKGKATHLFRVRLDNFLGDLDREKLLDLYCVLGSMGVGRNLVYYSSVTS